MSTRPADLANNDQTEYSLPDIGTINPDNPLFAFKQLRDDILLLLPQGKLDKIKHLIQLNDKYTVYADSSIRLSKSQQSIRLFESAQKFQSFTIDELYLASKEDKLNKTKEYTDLKLTALQSNIKQAVMIRDLVDELPVSEQSTFIQLLDKNISLRKKLQQI